VASTIRSWQMIPVSLTKSEAIELSALLAQAAAQSSSP